MSEWLMFAIKTFAQRGNLSYFFLLRISRKRYLRPFIVYCTLHGKLYIEQAIISFNWLYKRNNTCSLSFCVFFFKLKYSWFTMLCEFLIYRKVIHFFFRFFSITVYYKTLNSFLCYTLGPCCLSILYIFLIPNSSFTPPLPFPFGNYKYVLYVCACSLSFYKVEDTRP